MWLSSASVPHSLMQGSLMQSLTGFVQRVINATRKKILDKALKLYNLSIMSATHPALPVAEHHEGQQPNDCCINDSEKSGKESNQSDLEEYRSLSLGYANRSAVLLELEQYDKCVYDIDAALRYGYPKLLHSKLAERKAKCLIAQKRKSEAKEVLENALKDLAELSLDESKSKNSREALQFLVNQCESNENDTHSEAKTSQKDLQIDLSRASKEKLLFSCQTPTAPKLVDPSPTIPALSASVRMAYTPSQGRYLVAERDIHPGDVLVAETGYCSILHLDSSLRTHCSNCLSRCLTPVPCPSCTRVVFCSSFCCIQGLSYFHRQECNILPTLAALDMGKNSVLAYRILTHTTHKKLKALMPELLEESKHKAPESLGFNTQGIYSSSDYKTIYHLVHNKEQRSVSDLFKRCAMALTLTKLMIASKNHFVAEDGKPVMPTQEDILLTGCTLFIHMMNLPCNAHSVTELEVNVSRFQESTTQEIGSGAFGVLSLTNHSCNPAAARSSYGNVVVLRAIRFIPQGGEVTDSYGEHYGISPCEARRVELLQQYCFTCTCEACVNSWPTYPSLSQSLTLRCLKCSVPLSLSNGVCKRCNTKYSNKECNSNGNTLMYDYKEIEEQTKIAANECQKAYDSIIEGLNSEENMTTLIHFIELVDKYVQHPCKLYFEAQETLKHCFDRQGNCVYRKEESDGTDIFKKKRK